MNHDSAIQLLQHLDFILPHNHEHELTQLEQHWAFDVNAIKRSLQSGAPQFSTMVDLSKQGIEDVPKKIVFSSLDYMASDADKSIEMIEPGSVVGVYAHPFVTAQHLFTPRYGLLSLSHAPNKLYPKQDIVRFSLPKLLSFRQIHWFEQMGLSPDQNNYAITLDAYLFLKQNGHIHESFLIEPLVSYGNPFVLGLANLFELQDFKKDDDKDDDELKATQIRVNHHKKTLVYSALLHFLTLKTAGQSVCNMQSVTHKSLFHLELKANLSLLTRLEQFRAYACLQAVSQSMRLTGLHGVYRGLMQLQGLQPYFYLTLDQVGFSVAERLLALGYTLHPKIMPGFERTLNSLKSDRKVAAYGHNTYYHTHGVLGDIASSSKHITDDLTWYHLPNSQNSQNSGHFAKDTSHE